MRSVGFPSRTVPSAPAEASRDPSGAKATALIAPSWPVSGDPTGVGVAGSVVFHSRTVPSAPAEASRDPSGAKATALTPPVWPVSGDPSRVGAAGVLSAGGERPPVPPAGVAGQRPDGGGGGRIGGVPQPHGAVGTGGGQG